MEEHGWLLGVLAVWRVTHLLQAEDGPGDVFVRLRRAAGNGFWGRLLDCFHCASLWVALPAALVVGRDAQGKVLAWLACSGGAILLEKATRRDPPLPIAVHFEDEEVDDVVLRRTTQSAPSAAERGPH